MAKRIAYLHKLPKIKGKELIYPFELTICDKPCAGIEFNQSEKVKCFGKRDAKQYCKDNDIVPYNF